GGARLRVNDAFGVQGLLIWVGDTAELGDDPGPGLGVEALAVPLLEHLEGRVDMDEDEPAEGFDHRPDLPAYGVVGGDGCTDGDAAVLRDLRGHVADAPDVDVAVLLGEPQLRRQVLADQVAVEQSHRAAAHLVELGDEGVGDGRLAGPRQAREQDRESLPTPGWVAAT